MARRWTLVAHPAYFDALRAITPLDRYPPVVAIWEQLEETDDPTRYAEPVIGRAGRFRLKVNDYLVTYEINQERAEIRLLAVEK